MLPLTIAALTFAAAASAASCGCCEISSSGVLTSCRGCPASTTSLHLGNCGITALQPGSFASPTLSNVTGLDLSNNALHGLSASAFEGLSSLTILDLSSNFISAVAPGALSGETLPLLSTLDMGFNELPSVPSFLSLPNLTSLSLYWNPIPVFTDTSFSGVPRLTYLDANNCGLLNVSLRAFSLLTSLTTLNLGHNTLTQLPHEGWVGPSLLTTLALQFNAITVLPPLFFRAFPLLETLPIYSNQLVALAAGTFMGLTNLAGLYLNDNNLTTLYSGCFSGLSDRFQYLSLSGNMLSPAVCNANFASIATVPSACFS